MLVFLTSIRHPDTSKNYERVLDLFDKTVDSLSGQKTPIKLVAVCNAIPDRDYPDWVDFIAVDFPPVPVNPGAELNKEELNQGQLIKSLQFRDIGTKRAVGLIHLKQYNPSYVFVMDADDWFNINLSTFFEKQSHPAWRVNNGYWVDLSSEEYKRRNKLHLYCGSTYVFDFQFLYNAIFGNKLPNENPTPDQLLDIYDDLEYRQLLENHNYVEPLCEQLNINIRSIPFYAATYIVGTGENASNIEGHQRKGVNIDTQFLNTFNLHKHIEPRIRTPMSLLLDGLAYWKHRARSRY